MNSRLLYEEYGNNTFLYYIDNDIKKAWHIVADWYLDDLYQLLDSKDINIVLAMSPDETVTHLGNAFYTGYRKLYSFNRTQQNYIDFDTESTETERYKWRHEVWPEIISCMIEVSYNLANHLKHHHNESFANDFLSLSGSVDLRTVYGMIYKNDNDLDETSVGSNEEHSDAEYDSEHSH